MSEPAEKLATYEDLLRLPDDMRAESVSVSDPISGLPQMIEPSP